MDIATLLKAAAALEAGKAVPQGAQAAPKGQIVRGNAKYATAGPYRTAKGEMTQQVYLWTKDEGKDCLNVIPSTAIAIADYLESKFDVPAEVVAEIREAAAQATAAKAKVRPGAGKGFEVIG